MDEHFAPFVGDYIEQPVKLQHLAITYSEHPTDIWTPGRDPLETVRDLSHLTQLRSLKVKAPANGLAGLRNFPRSLTSLYIGGGCGEEELCIHLPDPAADSGQKQESECLRRLSSLEFRGCCVHIWAGSITLLQGLTSLSLCHSKVNRDLYAVTMLTNLESLDLTRVGIPRDLYPHERQPWGRFEAWPALRVFKFVGCWLIDNSTVLDIATVQEVHTGRLALGMETANIHLVLWHTCRHAIMLESLASVLSPAWSIHIVDLHVLVYDDMALHFATIVNQVLESLLCLQSFQLVGPLCEPGPADNIDHEQGGIVLGDGYSGQLKNLQLRYMHCSMLDLEVATCLTHISLNTIEKQDVSCELILPSSLVRLEFVGKSLTTRRAKCLLEGLPSLTHLTLGIGNFGGSREPELSGSACLPTMPSSLRWFRVTSTSLKKLLDASAQECLKYCAGLEYLTLPLGQYPKGGLYAWVKSARYVRVSDNDPTQDVW